VEPTTGTRQEAVCRKWSSKKQAPRLRVKIRLYFGVEYAPGINKASTRLVPEASLKLCPIGLLRDLEARVIHGTSM
jgi:hypothetical protein